MSCNSFLLLYFFPKGWMVIKRGSNHPEAQTMNIFTYLFIWHNFKKSKGATHGGGSHPLLPGLCRGHRLSTSWWWASRFFLRMERGSETRTGWGGMGRRCPRIWVQLIALPAWGLLPPKGAGRTRHSTDCRLCWWLGASSLGWHYFSSLLFSYRLSYKQG